MIHHIRALAANIQGELIADFLPSGEAPEVEELNEEDTALDLLVRHAVRDSHRLWLNHDPRQVWQRLSDRVRGPFGSMAVEQPAHLGTEMPLPEFQDARESGEANADPRRTGQVRLSDMAFPVR